MKKSFLVSLLVLGIVFGAILTIDLFADSVAQDGTKFTTTSTGDRKIIHTNGGETTIDRTTGKKMTGTSN